MKKIIFALLMQMFSISSNAETAKDALVSISKLNARTEVGISYKDYVAEVGATKYVVDEFVSGSKDKNAKCVESIQSVMNLHLIAVGSFKFQMKMSVSPLMNPPVWDALASSTKQAKIDCKVIKN